MDKARLLRRVQRAMPLLFPVTDILFRLPLVGRLFQFAIPVANYVGEPSLSRPQRYDWAVLDTFDMLSPEYDKPQTQGEAEAALREGGVEAIRRLESPGLNLVGRKGDGQGADVACAA
jgi:hypothetical protein